MGTPATTQFDAEGLPVRGGGRRTPTELVLPTGEYAYIQDTTKGLTITRVGPAVVNLQGQERPVVFNKDTGRFDECDLEQSAKVNTIVPKGHYCVLQNPADRHPNQSSNDPAPDLMIGERLHISGSASFSLWPRQIAEVIEGHQLRLNQYLLVRIYDEEAARENWASAVIKRAASASTDGGDTEEAVVTSDDMPEDLSVGRLLVIRGTEVSFYIPPTGIEVIKGSHSKYMREALTLERLQYCILIEEDGNKRYHRGPDVVFPKPTERFHENSAGDWSFRPIELNGSIQGIHIKVIADYTDTEGAHGKKGASYKEGDELFITGGTTPIYFPCEQHSAIKYDDKTKHYATAIPAGDGRYVMDRQTGQIKMVTGGKDGVMLLPDPRKEVFVRRALTDAECELMYPSNDGARNFNQTLRSIQQGETAVPEQVIQKSLSRQGARQALGSAYAGNMYTTEMASFEAASSAEMGGDEFSRGTTYTQPRTVTLGIDKFSGVPKIDIWTGFAILVKDTAGNRRVEVGPKRVLLAFDETVEALALSSGKPKTTDHLIKTAFLRTRHNGITEVVRVETSDHVEVEIKLRLRVNFKGDDSTRWFEVANYVKLLCDHVRSVLKATVRQTSVDTFYSRGEDFVRDTILGTKSKDKPRKGMPFDENGMEVYDVEVLAVVIANSTIQGLLVGAQHEAVQSSIKVTQAERRLEVFKRQQQLSQEEQTAKAETDEHNAKLQTEGIARNLKLSLEQVGSNVKEHEAELEDQTAMDAVKDADNQARIARQTAVRSADLTNEKAQQAIQEAWLAEETAAMVSRLEAAQGGFSEALLALGNQETLVKVAKAMSVQQFVGGKDLVDVISKVFAGTPLADILAKVQEKGSPKGNHEPKPVQHSSRPSAKA